MVKRHYPPLEYNHLPPELPINTTARVYHVTKEFGPAVTSDLGRYVTGLAAAQQASGLNNVAVIMPLYSFIKNLATKKEMDLSFDIQGQASGQITTLDFHVYKMTYAFNPPVQDLNKYEFKLVKGLNTSVLVTPQKKPTKADSITVYLIGPGNKRPFSQVFKSPTPQEIYSENPEISHEWRDQYFAKAVAAFISHKASASDEESIFAPIRIIPRVDLVHIHGVASAYVTKCLQDKRDSDELGPRPPAIVYTMYDQKDEPGHTQSIRSIKKFLDPTRNLQKYFYAGRMFMSRFAIDHAQVVTFASQKLAADVVQGKQDFYLQELVMESLLQKTQAARFYGINQAMDYHSTDHPFISDQLRDKSLLFPSQALDTIRSQPPLHASSPFALISPDFPTIWNLPKLSKNWVSVHKDHAKRLLVKRGILNTVQQPLLLFRGRFEPDVGLESLPELIPHLVQHDIRLVLLGTRKGYPMEELEHLQSLHPRHIYIISRAIDERRLGVFCRAAADFVWVPTVDPNDLEIQAAQGLVFGSAVISTGLGRMHNALIDRPHSQPRMLIENSTVTSHAYYNAYIYSSSSLASALSHAALDYRMQTPLLREEFVLRMIRSALNLAWDKGHQKGSVYEYNQVYQLALYDRIIPEIRRHEVEREKELVSRLQQLDV